MNHHQLNRFELKYLLPYQIAEKLKQSLKSHMHKDLHGGYRVSSLYYDTPEHHFYWEKIEGIKFRRKLRLRRYINEEDFTESSMVFVEIKQRIDRIVQKRRMKMSYKNASNFLNEGIAPPHKGEDRTFLEEVESMLKLYTLKPSLITSYQREAFIGTHYDAGLRITFDKQIGFRKNNLNLSDDHQEEYMISPDRVIMEIKVNDRIPYWLTEVVAKENFRLIRVSKYGQGLEAAAAVPKSFYYIH